MTINGKAYPATEPLRLKKGERVRLRIINASAEHTRVHLNRLFPRPGEHFVSNLRRPILFFEEDRSPGVHDMLVAAWGSPLIADSKVYIGDEDGDVAIFNLSKDKEVAMKEINGEWHPINAFASGPTSRYDGAFVELRYGAESFT